MPSPAYNIIREAIASKKNIKAYYHNHLREMTPHKLGTKGGKEQALFFQYAGGSSSGLPPGGEWRCLTLDELSMVSIIEGHAELHSAPTQGQPQTCIDIVDIAIEI